MLEQLRIQCPSCGIILDVRNSRHEAVKQIACPNCKKQLAVDFQDDVCAPSTEHQPLEALYYGEMRIALHEGVNQIPLPDCGHMEILVARLRDGSSKCMVRPLTSDSRLLVNRQPLLPGEQIALVIGDTVQTGNTVLSYGVPATTPPAEADAPESSEPLKPSRALRERTRIWLSAGVACIGLMIATVLLWPAKKQPAGPAVENVPTADTVATKTASTHRVSPAVQKPETPRGSSKGTVTEASRQSQAVSPTRSDYELEQLATRGNVKAQYELGNRLIRRKGANTVVRGIRYLQMAAANGSSEARSVLDKAVRALRRQAESGDTVAYNILMSTRNK